MIAANHGSRRRESRPSLRVRWPCTFTDSRCPAGTDGLDARRRRPIIATRREWGSHVHLLRHVVIGQVVTVEPCGRSLPETGCMGNSCRCPRRTTGGVATGDQSPMGGVRGRRAPRCASAPWSASTWRLAAASQDRSAKDRRGACIRRAWRMAVLIWRECRAWARRAARGPPQG
jgi:hypothetical protein